MSLPLQSGNTAPNFRFNTPWTSMQDFYDSQHNQNAVFIFLRYHGCPVCQMEIANLKNDIELFNQKNARVFVFLQSSPDTIKSLLKKEDLPFDIICDPKGIIFKLYAVEQGSILRYMHPAGLIASIKALSRGFVHKKFEGKETQLPAAFIIKSDKSISFAYYGKNISDVPKPKTLAEKIT